MKIINQSTAHSCKEYFSDSNTSEKEILNNLEQIRINLGEQKTAVFVSKAYRVLKQATKNLYLSIENRDLYLCSQYAHKLRGSSNLYAIVFQINNFQSIISRLCQILYAFCSSHKALCQHPSYSFRTY